MINREVKADQNIDQSKPRGMAREQRCHYTDDDKAHERVQIYSGEPPRLSMSRESKSLLEDRTLQLSTNLMDNGSPFL